MTSGGVTQGEGGPLTPSHLWPDKWTTLTLTGNSNAHGARPVHQIISMIKWIRTRKLSIKNSLSHRGP